MPDSLSQSSWTNSRTGKHLLQDAIRRSHLLWLKPLPPKVAIYFHRLPSHRWPEFESAIEFLRSGGYQIVDPFEFANQDSHSVKAHVSFDDNFTDWHAALPLFDRLGVRATFYLNTQPIRDFASESEITSYFHRIHQDTDDVKPLSSDEIREISAAGHTLGAHGHSHQALTSLSVEAAIREVRHSRSVLSDIAGLEIVHFSYPFGMRRHFNKRLRSMCIAEGFHTVANAIPGLLYAEQKPESIQRTLWNLDRPLEYNIENMRIDGRLFALLTGRAATPC